MQIMYESHEKVANERTQDAEFAGNFANLPGLRLHYLAAGSGPSVVLLHGFPEFSWTWKHQLRALVAAGFRGLAPDLRGYHLSDKPTGVRAYAIEELVGDVAAFIESEAGGRAIVVGHDWGGVIAWRLAAWRPELVSRLAILNAPLPAAYSRELRRNPLQWLRSWYMLCFQVPGLAEWALARRNFAALDGTFRDAAGRSLFSAEDRERFKEAMAVPGTLTAALNYYRAAFRFGRGFAASPQTITVPTLVVWGERDPYLGSGLSRGLERWVTDLRVERLPNVGHWVQHEAPEHVNQLLLSFFQESR